MRKGFGSGGLRWVSMLSVVVAIGVVCIPGALAVHDTGLFQLDGNATTDASSPGDDWDRVCHQVSPTTCPTGSNSSAAAVDWTADTNAAQSHIFVGGGSKDPSDVTDWAWKTGSVPDKDNLLHAFAARYDVPATSDCPSTGPTCDVLYFGSDRFDNSGDAQQGFWFFQNKIDFGTNKVGGGTGFTGMHKDGDLLVISDFSNGGTTSVISVYQWDSTCKKAGGSCADSNLRTLASSGDANCDNIASGDQFCGIVNPQDGTPSPWPFLDKSGNTTFAQGELYEAGVNLSTLGLGSKCFSSILSETRSSTSTSAVLKDFVLGGLQSCGARITINPPSAVNEVGQTHTFTVHVDKVQGSTFTPIEGAHPTVTLTASNGATITNKVDNCASAGTDASGDCTVTFTSTTAGTVTGHAEATVTVDGSTFTVATDGSGDNSGDAVKRFVDAKIAVSPLTATNEVNHAHTITATVQQNDGTGSGFVAAPDGTAVTFSLTNNTANATFVSGNTCTTTGGTCSVQINSTSAGSVTIHATTTFSVGGISLTRATGTGAPNSADATKRYVDAKISVSPLTATNAVGQAHTITANVQQNDGTGAGFTAAPNGTLVTFSLLNNTANATFVGGNTCTTTGGTCSVQINSTSAGSVDIHATTTFTVGGISLTRATGDGLSGDSADANKHYVDARITLSPLSAVNEVNNAHTFTATVEQNTGSGFVAAPDGTSVVFSLTNNTAGAVFVGPSTCTTTNGTCSVQITSSSAGTVHIHATTTFSVAGFTLTRSTGTDGPNSPDATKQYVDAKISLSPLTATNAVGQPHTITATVQQDDGLPIGGTGGDSVSGFGPAPDGTTVTFSLVNNTANATFVGGVNTCTTTGGTCSVQINSTSAGSVDIHATTTFTVGGISVTRATGTGAPNSADAHKSYVDAKITLSPLTATNGVGQAHTITATVQQNTGSGFVAAPDGTTVTFSLLNNTASATFVGGSTCTTTGGTCSVQINSTSAGSVDIHATTTFTVGGISVTRATGTGAPNSADANKRYVDAKISLSPLTATNPVGQAHTITATVQQDDGLAAGANGGDGATGFGPAPDGTKVTFSLLNNTAGATFVNGNTCTTSGGTCTIQINSTSAGGVDIHATTTFDVGGVSLTRATGTGAPNSADAHKDYEKVPSNTVTHPQQNGSNVTSIDFGQSVTDHAVVSGNAGVAPTGTVTFSICSPTQLTGGVCSSGGTTVSPNVALSPIDNSSSQADSASFMPTTPGTWCWRADYSGDNTYKVSSDATTGECFTVGMQGTHVDTGQKATITDTAKPTGFGTPTGTVTFQLYTSSDCTTGKIYDSGPVQLVGGVAKTTSDPNLTLKDNGTYNWLVSYSGDANNEPSTSPCGTEKTTISGNTPGVDP